MLIWFKNNIFSCKILSLYIKHVDFLLERNSLGSCNGLIQVCNGYIQTLMGSYNFVWQQNL